MLLSCFGVVEFSMSTSVSFPFTSVVVDGTAGSEKL